MCFVVILVKIFFQVLFMKILHLKGFITRRIFCKKFAVCDDNPYDILFLDSRSD